MPEHTALYRLYDAEGELLYVGITSDTKTRFASHATRSWWSRVARTDVTRVSGTRRDALAAEAKAIRNEKPLFNRKHNSPQVPFHPEDWPVIEAPPRGKASALADLVRAEITGGRWPSGAKPPPREELAAATGVSEGTAALAYRYLQKEGLLEFRHGRGTFVANAV